MKIIECAINTSHSSVEFYLCLLTYSECQTDIGYVCSLKNQLSFMWIGYVFFCVASVENFKIKTITIINGLVHFVQVIFPLKTEQRSGRP